MKKKQNIYIASLFVLIFLFGFWLGRIVYKDNSLFYSSNSNFRKVKVLIDYLQDNYKNKINIADFLEQSLIEKIKQLDPYAEIVPADNYQNWSDQLLNNDFYGIGIQYKNWKDTIHILKVYPNSPAQKAGLMPFDMIVEVNGQKLNSKTFKITKNRQYKLKVIKYSTGKAVYLSLRPEKIEYNNIVAKNLDSGIIYIQIKAFSENVLEQFINAVDSLSKITKFKGFIIDLRGNRGGLLRTSVELVKKFLPQGDTITTIENKNGERKFFIANQDGEFCDLPLVVLINPYTASASEMFCMAIQDNDRGYLIGNTTFGKGVYQQDVKFFDSYAHITTGKYYGPSGRNLSEFSARDTFLTKNGRQIIPEYGVCPDEFLLPEYNFEEIFSLIDYFIPDSMLFSFVDATDCQLRSVSTSNELKKFLKLNTSKDILKGLDIHDLTPYNIDQDTIRFLYFGRFVLPNRVVENCWIRNDNLISRARQLIRQDSVEKCIFQNKIIQEDTDYEDDYDYFEND